MRSKRETFESRELRRSERIFCQMTKFLKSRSSEQCRSHYQKYELKFQTFDNIVAHIDEKILLEDEFKQKREKVEKDEVFVKLEEKVKIEEKTRTSRTIEEGSCEVIGADN